MTFSTHTIPTLTHDHADVAVDPETRFTASTLTAPGRDMTATPPQPPTVYLSRARYSG